jgi:predicted O-methyltransferase YrrM
MKRPFLLFLAASVCLAGDAEVRAYQQSMLRDQRRAMSVDPVDGEFFHKITLDLKAKRVLEIGTSTGYSGSWFALALQKTGGKLVTLEMDPGRHAEAQKNFAAMGLAPVIESRLGNALELLPTLEGPFDIVFIDAWKPDYLRYYELVLPKVRPGGVILAHNVKNVAGQMGDFLSRIRQDPAVRTEFLAESIQGLSISWKK